MLAKSRQATCSVRAAFLKNNYLYRMTAAVLGIYGNTKEEAMYPAYYVDADGKKLDGANRYTLRFAPGQLPPVNSFWSSRCTINLPVCSSPTR